MMIINENNNNNGNSLIVVYLQMTLRIYVKSHQEFMQHKCRTQRERGEAKIMLPL